MIPHHQEISMQEAANLLNVSHPFLISLLEKNKLRHRKVDGHQRVLLTDVLEYRQKALQLRDSALDELAAISQIDSMGY